MKPDKYENYYVTLDGNKLLEASMEPDKIPYMNVTIKRRDTNSQTFVAKYTENLNFITIIKNSFYHYNN